MCPLASWKYVDASILLPSTVSMIYHSTWHYNSFDLLILWLTAAVVPYPIGKHISLTIFFQVFVICIVQVRYIVDNCTSTVNVVAPNLTLNTKLFSYVALSSQIIAFCYCLSSAKPNYKLSFFDWLCIAWQWNLLGLALPFSCWDVVIYTRKVL